jgi:hypothetical protein
MADSKTLMRVPQDRERRAAARMTGRYLVTVQKDAHQEVAAKLATAGFRPAPALKVAGAAKPLPRGGLIMMPNVGVAVVDPGPEQEEALQKLAADEGAIIALEPERIVHASATESLNDYMRGWRDAVDALAGKLIRESRRPPPWRLPRRNHSQHGASSRREFSTAASQVRIPSWRFWTQDSTPRIQISQDVKSLLRTSWETTNRSMMDTATEPTA